MVKLPFLPQKEKVLIVEIAPAGTRGFLFTLGADKVLALKRCFSSLAWGKSVPILHVARRADHIIITLHPEYTYTVLKNVELIRTSKKTPIEAIELENFLGQTVSNVFIERRPEASAALGVEELHTILMESRATGFSIDGHHVLNPVGVEGGKITVSLECTMTTREIFESLNPLFSAGKDFFMSDTGRAILGVCERDGGLPAACAMLGEEHSLFFELRRTRGKEKELRRGELPWTTRAPLSALMEGWGVSDAVARRIEEGFIEGLFSGTARRSIGKLFEVGERALFRALRAAHLRGRTVVLHNRAFPLASPTRAGSISLDPFHGEEALERAGITLKEESCLLPSAARAYVLASFLEFYYDSSDATVNRWLKRRIHWIAH